MTFSKALEGSSVTRGLTFEQFQSEDIIFDAVVRNLEIIGEEAKHLPPEGRAMMPDVD
ncbi:MAG TPA: HepT-like ribonuclease domain-containing protein [Nitrospira sp.]|nr:HepT-like ribonuclease domain-containing protein [Nitrospira sp.]